MLSMVTCDLFCQLGTYSYKGQSLNMEMMKELVYI